MLLRVAEEALEVWSECQPEGCTGFVLPEECVTKQLPALANRLEARLGWFSEAAFLRAFRSSDGQAYFLRFWAACSLAAAEARRDARERGQPLEQNSDFEEHNELLAAEVSDVLEDALMCIETRGRHQHHVEVENGPKCGNPHAPGSGVPAMWLTSAAEARGQASMAPQFWHAITESMASDFRECQDMLLSVDELTIVFLSWLHEAAVWQHLCQPGTNLRTAMLPPWLSPDFESLGGAAQRNHRTAMLDSSMLLRSPPRNMRTAMLEASAPPSPQSTFHDRSALAQSPLVSHPHQIPQDSSRASALVQPPLPAEGSCCSSHPRPPASAPPALEVDAEEPLHSDPVATPLTPISHAEHSHLAVVCKAWSPSSAGGRSASRSPCGGSVTLLLDRPALDPLGSSVVLHIYDVSRQSGIQRLNSVLCHERSPLKLGGVFHAGVEVHGLEWSFGLSLGPSPGVESTRPREHPDHSFRQSIYLGWTELSSVEVSDLISILAREYPGPDYDLLTRNCCHFADDLSQRLGVGALPGWVYRLARIGASIDRALQVGRRLSRSRSFTSRPSWARLLDDRDAS